MNAKTAASADTKTSQEVCIDLPGESVQCWRSNDNIKVILRKHRDVFFEINIKQGTSYTVESISDFYCPRDKKLLKKTTFQDGERLHLWIGREFKGKLVLKKNTTVIGTFEANKLDSKKYDADPKTKPEPLMVVMGKKELPSSLSCTANDPFGMSATQGLFKPMFDPKMSFIKSYGTDFDYQYTEQQPEVGEYVCITDALVSEIQPQVLKQLDGGVAVEGTIDQIFISPKNSQSKSDLYTAIVTAAAYISGSEFLTSNSFKETAGYFQEHWKQLDKILMRVRVEKRAVGKYRVLFKGTPLKRVVTQLLGGPAAKKTYQRLAQGSERSAFMDGGFGKTGRAGYGGIKRMMLTVSKNFRGGMKMQIIGTVIDFVGDANTVYFDEKGSQDFTEFLGRAGVSLAKAGATAAIGSVIAAGAVAFATFIFGAAALPVAAAILVVVAGFIAAATLVDLIDESFDIKNSVAGWAR